MVTHRNRNFPTDLWRETHLRALPTPVKWTAASLHAIADDHGRAVLDEDLLRSDMWMKDPWVTDEVLVEHLLTLEAVGYLSIWPQGSLTFLELTLWPKQDRPAPSRLPPSPVRAQDARNPLADYAVEERARERVGESGWAPAAGEPVSVTGSLPPDLAAELPPNCFCPEHPNGIYDDCRHCGTARLNQDQWLRRQRAAKRARQRAATDQHPDDE
jgi:hypothetical protein